MNPKDVTGSDAGRGGDPSFKTEKIIKGTIITGSFHKIFK